MILNFKIALYSLIFQVVLLTTTVAIGTCHLLWAIVIFCLLAAPITSVIALVGLVQSFMIDKSFSRNPAVVFTFLLLGCAAIFIATSRLSTAFGHAGC